MRATIKSVNFSSEIDWLFLLEDSAHNIYYIADDKAYRNNGLNNPVNKHLLDQAGRGTSVMFESVIIDGRNIVTKILSFS